MARKKKNPTTDRAHFDSLAALLDEVKQNTRHPDLTAASVSAGERFTGTADYSTAYHLARGGWQEGTQTLDRARDLVKIPDSMRTQCPAPIMAEEGDEIMVDRYLDGESDHFLSFPMQETPRAGKVVSLVYNLATSFNVSRETMTNRGAAALALVDALEASGLRVEVTICGLFTADNGDKIDMRATLKRAEDPLELDRAAFWMTHPSSLRRLLFRVMERRQNFKPFASNYGIPTNYTPDQLAEGCIYFPAHHSGQMSEQEAVSLALAKLDTWTANFSK